MRTKKYHYEYFAYTDNLCYGRMFLGHDKSLDVARWIAINSNKGCYIILKKRVYDN